MKNRKIIILLLLIFILFLVFFVNKYGIQYMRIIIERLLHIGAHNI